MSSTAFRVDATIEKQIAGWLRDLGAVRRLAPNTLEAYQRDLSAFFVFLAGHTGGPVNVATLKDMRAADIRAYFAVRREDDLQSRSLARALSAIKSFFRFLEREGVMATEALNVVRTPKAKKSLPKALTVLEAKSAIATTEEMEERPWVAARDMAVLSLCYGAGLRISEALAVTRADLDTNVLRVTGKGGKTRMVPLIAAVRASIETYL
jgi:integrase/recombinase XerC